MPTELPHRSMIPLSPGKLVRAVTRRWLGPLARDRTIVRVTVRDQDFRVVRVLASEHDLAAFSELWAAMTEADLRSWALPPGRSHHKLDIQWRDRSRRRRTSRWLYHPGGFVNLVAIGRAIWVAPLYRMPSPNAFETLLRSQDCESTRP
jgi:hypothetical protein